MGGGGGGTTRPAHLPFLTMRVRLDVRLYSLSATLCLCDSLTVVCLCAEHDPRLSAVFCILDEMYVSLVYPYDISFSLSTVVRLTSHFFFQNERNRYTSCGAVDGRSSTAFSASGSLGLMFARKASYETAPDPDTLDDLSKKLAVDLRKHVRRLDSHALFTSVRSR